jgi:integrase/recombinase XerC
MRGNIIHRRMSGQKLYKIVKALGMAHGIPTLHPHALRHACAVEMLRRTRNLAAVQQHLRHVDVNTTTIYARLLPQDMEEVAKLFDRDAMR